MGSIVHRRPFGPPSSDPASMADKILEECCSASELQKERHSFPNTHSSSLHGLFSAQLPLSARPSPKPSFTSWTTLLRSASFCRSSVVSSSPTILSSGKKLSRWSEMSDWAERSATAPRCQKGLHDKATPACPPVTGLLSGFSTVSVACTDLVLIGSKVSASEAASARSALAHRWQARSTAWMAIAVSCAYDLVGRAEVDMARCGRVMADRLARIMCENM